jgi:invasion protein IalB
VRDWYFCRCRLTIAIGLCCIAASAAAQEANVPANRSNWRVECANSGKALDCRAYVNIVERNTHQTITSLIVRYSAETRKPVLMVQVPLGILVSEPVSLQVDDGKPENTRVQTCTKAGCFAGEPVPDDMIAAMHGGKQFKVVFYNIKKQPVTVTIPLAGFALAYDKIKG